MVVNDHLDGLDKPGHNKGGISDMEQIVFNVCALSRREPAMEEHPGLHRGKAVDGCDGGCRRRGTQCFQLFER